MNFKALQARAKESHVTGKTIEVQKADGTTQTVDKISRKKRFGKSLKNHAPAALITKLERKVKAAGGSLRKVQTAKFKASQYDHVTNTYEKHELGQRSKKVGGKKVQRDLYSAFLLKNSNKNGTKPKRPCHLKQTRKAVLT